MEAIMNRKNIRENIFKIIFSYEFGLEVPIEEHIEDYLGTIEVKDDEAVYIKTKAMGIVSKKAELDATIGSSSTSWNLKRIANVEMAILRLALFEILYDEEIPTNVAINEAIEMARKYGGDQSPKFVNGVIAGIVNE
ncbi:MAG: transcription antitermination factor NusB [Firmicutes bacterium HGW-Firmicutes-5]|nr:MAG: transcription antitermination factor NusB [Firmicutes bacterium HGW-Firmicutes-5]